MGQKVKGAGLGGLGTGASILGWGLDPSTIKNQINSNPQVSNLLSAVLQPIDKLINPPYPTPQTTPPMPQPVLHA